MGKHKVFLITGWAQSGKDSLADVIMKELGGRSVCAKVSFADPLKSAANIPFRELGLGHVDFRKEEWKKKHRKVLVALAEAAREENVNVFAQEAAKTALLHQQQGRHVVVPDWRYVNECEAFDSIFGKDVIRVRMWKKGGKPGNDSERLSIQQVEDSCILNYVGVFDEGDNKGIINFGRHIVDELR